MANGKSLGWVAAAILAIGSCPTPSGAAVRGAREGSAPATVSPMVVYIPVTLDLKEVEAGAIDLASLLKRTTLAGCSGGTCATATNTVLSCPTSGGPTCSSGTSCNCTCGAGPNGSWIAANRCENP